MQANVMAFLKKATLLFFFSHRIHRKHGQKLLWILWLIHTESTRPTTGQAAGAGRVKGVV
jgi:hypothetical protein